MNTVIGDEQTTELLHGIRDAMNTRIDPIVKQLAELQARVNAIEDRGIKYTGVYQPAAEYVRGNLVTFAGSLWHANTATRSVPGKDATWTLAVKSGSRGG